ncbi:MAG TPA: hypothetical protein VMA37_15515 [Acetobacteraceae bacterium]|nr:hypothetical protein [Acetobacteraceae bacterium]
MKTGTIMLVHERPFVVLAQAGTICAIAPLVLDARERMAGDVDIEPRLRMRTAESRIVPGGLQAMGELPSQIAEQCAQAARRVALTQRIIERHTLTHDWHREAANEVTALR